MEHKVYQRYIKNASDHWWWSARIEIFSKIIEVYFKYNRNLNILDYGAGSGVNINFLNKFGKVTIYEPHQPTLKYLKENFTNIKLLGNKNVKFDIILLADVLEHIEYTDKILDQLYKYMHSQSIILITVPAHQYLYNKKDLILKHYRRYSKKLLYGDLKKSGFNIDYLSYYNFFLAPIILPITLVSKILKLNYIEQVEKKPLFILNKIFFNLFRLEKFLISKKIKLPYGISLIAVAKK